MVSKQIKGFKQKFNAIKGIMEWSAILDDYDFHQEISRSAYGDMLHDSERNLLYKKAIEKSVKHLLKKLPNDEKLRVLDIGTGTGLLSMFAVKAAGQSPINVDAYECFQPIADCAEKVIKRNGFDNAIKVIKKRSVGGEELINRRAHLLVTEVFDTELIGEGALSVFRFANHQQLIDRPLIVPWKARVWAQLLTSKWLTDGHEFSLKRISHPDEYLNCNGSNELNDLQLSQLIVNKDLKLISQPFKIFEFEFSDLNTLKLNEEKLIKVELSDKLKDSIPIAIAVWWDLFMDWECEYFLNCAPNWAKNENEDKQVWRDHWMQAIYFPLIQNKKNFIKNLNDKNSNEINLIACHDEYSFWFKLNESDEKLQPGCDCHMHSRIARSRLRMLNDNHLSINNLLIICDLSFLPIVLANEINNLNLIYLFISEESKLTRTFLNQYINKNNLNNKIKLIDNKSELNELNIDTILFEPYFQNISLPWDVYSKWINLFKSLTNEINLNKIKNFLPMKMKIKFLTIEFDHLWKIRSPIGFVDDINLIDFDNLITQSMNITEASIEPQPLWEYSNRSLLEQSIELFEIDLFNKNFNQQHLTNECMVNVNKNILRNEQLTICFALWAEFYLNEEIILNTGCNEIKLNEYINWERNWKQGVSFIFTNEKFFHLNNKTNEYEIKFKSIYSLDTSELKLISI